MAYTEISAPKRKLFGLRALLALLVVALLSARAIAGAVMEYNWWREMGQIPAWLNMLAYGVAPLVAASLLAFVVLMTVHFKSCNDALAQRTKVYTRVSTLILLLAAVVL
ncbi:MAG: hypothetical protein ACRD44_06600, partial [Bryobacteraceae bacterium]